MRSRERRDDGKRRKGTRCRVCGGRTSQSVWARRMGWGGAGGCDAGKPMSTGKEVRMEDRDGKWMHQDLPEIYTGCWIEVVLRQKWSTELGVHGEKRSGQYEAKPILSKAWDLGWLRQTGAQQVRLPCRCLQREKLAKQCPGGPVGGGSQRSKMRA